MGFIYKKGDIQVVNQRMDEPLIKIVKYSLQFGN